jgi:poly-gamma-glutamate synthesis protein (capsule biosynthesis protein)
MVSARLGAIIALTLAGITITVAYDRSRDSTSKVDTEATTTTAPTTTVAVTAVAPPSTVDITSLTEETTPAEPPRPAPGVSSGLTAGGSARAVPVEDRLWRGSEQTVTFMFAGDSQFEGAVASQLAADPNTVLLPMAPVFEQADLSMVNLETAITERGSPEPKEFTFRAPATAFTALAAAGVDVVSMANNHGRDFGADGLQDTLAAIQTSGYPTVGIGGDATEAYAPYRVTIKGQRIAVFGASRVIDSDLLGSWTASDTQPGIASAYEGAPRERLLAEVRAARASSDTIVVYLHWGNERLECPTGVQKVLARELRDAGADIIVGAHAHRVQGDGYLDGAFVAYGLGNFVWPRGDVGAVIEVKATGRVIEGYRWIPMSVNASVPSPMNEARVTEQVADWEQLRSCTDLSA